MPLTAKSGRRFPPRLSLLLVECGALSDDLNRFHVLDDLVSGLLPAVASRVASALEALSERVHPVACLLIVL